VEVPASLDVLLQSLATLRQPSGSLYRLYTEAAAEPDDTPTGYRYGPNRIEIGGTPVDVGFSVDLTIERRCRRSRRRRSRATTGRQDICRALGIARREDAGRAVGYNMLEKAVVRMAAVAVIDVASGRIEALAGALTPCTRQGIRRARTGQGCDKRLPYAPRYRPDALLNPACFTTRCGLRDQADHWRRSLTDPDVGARWLAAERAAMQKRERRRLTVCAGN